MKLLLGSEHLKRWRIIIRNRPAVTRARLLFARRPVHYNESPRRDEPFSPNATFRFQRLPAEEQLQRASFFFQAMSTRGTIRAFSPEPLPFDLIETAIKTAGTAPSGVDQQPWRFFGLDLRSETADPGSGRDSRKRVLSAACPSRVACRTGAVRQGLAEVVSRDCALSGCHFSTRLWFQV